MSNDLPLDGVTVVDFSQFLAGPYCSLRLSDLGARIIKVENPNGGDLSRRLYTSDTQIGKDSTIFHAINRGKESISLDLKSVVDLEKARQLIKQADVVIQNYRPGVIERLGLDYDAVNKINSSIVYGSVSGYGTTGPWVPLPGQDLLAQARSGILWLNGDRNDGPVPVGLPVADILAGAALAQGVLAALVRKATKGVGMKVETSLLEALVDLQFEVLTTYLNDGKRLPNRASEGSAHAYLAAPYGVYRTSDGFITVAMTSLPNLQKLLNNLGIQIVLKQQKDAFVHRDQIMLALAQSFEVRHTQSCLDSIEGAGVWCAPVYDWDDLVNSEAFQMLDMIDHAGVDDATSLLRSPLRLNGKRTHVRGVGPSLDQDGDAIAQEFNLNVLDQQLI